MRGMMRCAMMKRSKVGAGGIVAHVAGSAESVAQIGCGGISEIGIEQHAARPPFDEKRVKYVG